MAIAAGDDMTNIRYLSTHTRSLNLRRPMFVTGFEEHTRVQHLLYYFEHLHILECDQHGSIQKTNPACMPHWHTALGNSIGSCLTTTASTVHWIYHKTLCCAAPPIISNANKASPQPQQPKPPPKLSLSVWTAQPWSDWKAALNGL